MDKGERGVPRPHTGIIKQKREFENKRLEDKLDVQSVRSV